MTMVRALLTNVPMAMNLLRLRLQEVTLAIDKPVSSVLEREKLLTHSWNIEGLVPKALDKSFINYLSGLDFFCLLETSVDSFTFPSLCNYNVFCKPALKLLRLGRKSGGTIVLIRKEVMLFVTEVKVEYDNILVFIINKDLLGFSEDVALACAYFLPEHSPYL